MADKNLQDFTKPYLRLRRTLRHLWHITRGDKEFNPNGCDGCKEIHNFLTDPSYLGDEHYPVGVEFDPDLGPMWHLGPDEMELPSRALIIDCEVCDQVRPFMREPNRDRHSQTCKIELRLNRPWIVGRRGIGGGWFRISGWSTLTPL